IDSSLLPCFLRFQKTRFFEVLDEGIQGFGRKRGAELLFCIFPNGLKRCLAVELLRNELFRLPETKELARNRIFEDETTLAVRLLAADGQITPKFGRRSDHHPYSTKIGYSIWEGHWVFAAAFPEKHRVFRSALNPGASTRSTHLPWLLGAVALRAVALAGTVALA